MIASRTLVLALLVTLAVTLAPAAASTAADTGDARVTRLRPEPAPEPTRVVQAFDQHDGHARLAPGRKWPGGTIRYVDTSKDSGAVERAVKFWNRSGVKVQFKKVKKTKKADLVIRNSKRVPNGCGTGLATLGYTKGRKGYVNILHGADADGQTCAWPGQTLVMTHELGHVLGLGHDDSRCSIMNSSHTNGVAPSGCFTADRTDYDEAPGRWRCRGPERIDLKRAKKLYGGTVEVRDETWCDIVPVMPSAGAITAVPTGTGGGVQLTLRRESDPVLPGFLAAVAVTPGYELHMTAGACTAVPRGDSIIAGGYWTVAPGTDEPISTGYPTPGGVQCFTSFAYDNLGRLAALPSSALVTLP